MRTKPGGVGVEFLKKTPSPKPEGRGHAKPEACADIVDALLVAQYYVELVSEFC